MKQAARGSRRRAAVGKLLALGALMLAGGVACLRAQSSTNAPPAEVRPQVTVPLPGGGSAGQASGRNNENNSPIDITAEGGTNYVNRVAKARGNVNIVTNDASIFCDEAEYNLDTHEALLIGNVRIYRLDTVFNAERALYNFNTKAIRALDFQGLREGYFFGGVDGFSPGAGYEYRVRQSTFTSHDSSKPDYHVTARRLRIYPDDHAVYVGATLFVGQTPVFYFPYFYQSLDRQSGYRIVPGYNSEYGAYLLLGLTFPITDKVTGLARFDYRTKRGAAAGLDLEYNPRLRTHRTHDGSQIAPYASDNDPSQAVPAPTAPTNSPGRGIFDLGLFGNDTNGNARDDADTGLGRGGLAPTGDTLSREIRSKEGAKLITYFTKDDQPDYNNTGLYRFQTPAERYRVDLAATHFFTDDVTLKVNLDKLSDRYVLQDFYQGEFTRDPVPDNVAFLSYRQPDFVATLLARAQLNNFFTTTERLPEASFEIPRHPLFEGSPIFYESENSAGYLHRSFSSDSVLPSYSSYRIDSLHQFTFPKTYFNWLSLVPRIGLRGTYYTRSSPVSNPAYNLLFASENDLATLFTLRPLPAPGTDNYALAQEVIAARQQFNPRGGIFRPVFNAGFETSFKLSRVYPQFESRMFGLDRMQHVVQPYLNFSYIDDFGVGSRRLLPFNRRVASTQLDPIDFPQVTTIDNIDTGVFARVGVRNRLQTRRDALTFNWLEVDTFFQANIVNPYGPQRFSNIFNRITFRPLPWFSLNLDAQFPLFDTATGGQQRANLNTGSTLADLLTGVPPNQSIGGFTEINTALNFQVTRDLDLQISHRYLDNNPFFQNSNLFTVGTYYRFDHNWAAGFTERVEFADRLVEAQSYSLYRDLSSFVASFVVTVRNNSTATKSSNNDYGVLLNITLKDFPRLNLPVGFDVNSLENQISGN